MPEVQPLPLPQDLLTPTRAARRALTALAALLTLAPIPARAQSPAGPIEVILDASGSMRGRLGEAERMDVARSFVTELRAALSAAPESASPMALRVYGATSHRLRRDCSDTQLVPLAPDSTGAWTRALAAVEPLGVSPLAYALERAAADSATTYVLVTDGGDNCGGDPCDAWRAAVGRTGNRRLRLHVVALDPEPADLERLRCASRTGSGSFTLLRDPGEARDAADRLALVLQDRGRIDVRLSVGPDEPFAAPVRLLRPLTGEVVAAFNSRAPRAVPAGIYTLSIETAPPIRVERAMVLPGETLTVERSEFGRLVVTLPDSARAPVSIRSPGGGPELRYVRTGDPVVLGAGAYDVSVDLGDSVATREGVDVAAGRTTRVTIGSTRPGTLTILAPDFESPPPTRAFLYRDAGIDTLALGEPVEVAPGRYRLVVQTLPPYVTDDVEVEPGGERVVALPETGVLGVEIQGPDGPIRGVRVDVREPMTGELYGSFRSGERRLVMPGTYRLEIRTAPATAVDGVFVAAGGERVVERTGYGRIGLAAGAAAGEPVRLEVLTEGGRRLAQATGLQPSVAARPGAYLARVWRGPDLVWEGRVTVAPGESARIDWRGP